MPNVKKQNLKKELNDLLQRNKVMKNVELTAEEKEELLYNGSKISNTFKNLSISVAKFDKDLNICYFDSSHVDSNVENLLDKRLDQIFNLNEDILEIMEMKQRVLETGKIQSEKVTHPSENVDNTYGIICEPIYNNSNKIVGISTITIDITEQEKIHQQLIHAEKLAEIGQFATGIVHEFNNILANMMGKIDLLLLKEKQNQFNLTKDAISELREVKEQGQKAKKIAYDIMNISGSKSEDRELCSIKQVINNILEVKQRQLNIQNITVIKKYHPVRKVKMHTHELDQIFLNLIINAQDAMKKDKEGILKITVKEVGEEIEIRVSDTGKGMDDKEQKQIFTPFFSTKGELTEDYQDTKGNGLGLTVTLKIIKNYNGSIKVNSSKGEGTEFIIRLPIAKELL